MQSPYGGGCLESSNWDRETKNRAKAMLFSWQMASKYPANTGGCGARRDIEALRVRKGPFRLVVDDELEATDLRSADVLTLRA